jgi:hypothetical protein
VPLLYHSIARDQNSLKSYHVDYKDVRNYPKRFLLGIIRVSQMPILDNIVPHFRLQLHLLTDPSLSAGKLAVRDISMISDFE